MTYRLTAIEEVNLSVPIANNKFTSGMLSVVCSRYIAHRHDSALDTAMCPTQLNNLIVISVLTGTISVDYNCNTSLRIQLVDMTT